MSHISLSLNTFQMLPGSHTCNWSYVEPLFLEKKECIKYQRCKNECKQREDLPPANAVLLPDNKPVNFRKTIRRFDENFCNKTRRSHANIISAGLSEYSEPPWTSGKLQLRPINKILHLWNPEESSHDPSPILQTASSLPNLGILRCSFSSTDIIKTVRNKDNLSKDVSQPKNDWKYKKIKSDLSLNKNKCSNEPKHCSFKFKETQSNSEMDVESNSESSDSHSTENIYIEIEEKKYLPVWSEPFVVNQVELKSLDTVKSVELLKTVLPPVYLQVQRLNTINLRDNIDYVEDLSSTDTFTEDDIEIIQRIINDFEEQDKPLALLAIANIMKYLWNIIKGHRK
ncbi:unnamed protein product [Trichobilharzia regenti]|nr:unnamed protein product [Trichobilharzia regenti]